MTAVWVVAAVAVVLILSIVVWAAQDRRRRLSTFGAVLRETSEVIVIMRANTEALEAGFLALSRQLRPLLVRSRILNAVNEAFGRPRKEF